MKGLTKIKTYTVWDSKTGKTFATLKEAKGYEQSYRKQTGTFLSITEGSKKVTHSFTPPIVGGKKVKPSWIKK